MDARKRGWKHPPNRAARAVHWRRARSPACMHRSKTLKLCTSTGRAHGAVAACQPQESSPPGRARSRRSLASEDADMQ